MPSRSCGNFRTGFIPPVSAGLISSVTDAASNVTAYTYDTENNLTKITDALLRETQFAYDPRGRVTQVTFTSALYETYIYDAVGNLLSKTDRKGQTITYSYDNLDRLVQKEYPDDSTVGYVYDHLSRLTQVSDATGTYEFAYDNLGRLTASDRAYSFLPSRTFTVEYGYDAASNRTEMTDPEGGLTIYAYDNLNRLTTLTPPAAIAPSAFTFSYDVLSRRTQMTRPNGVSTDYAYDHLSRLLSALHKLGGNTIDGASYTVDAVGNRTAKTNHLPSAPVEAYTYDPIYQLTQVAQAGPTTTESYSYDPVGNRIASLAASPWSYNSSNQLTSIAGSPGTTFAYDSNGNTTSKTDASGTTTYTWDYENRLMQVALPGSGGTVSFTYDPLGRRVRKQSASATTIYAYDGENIVEETDASGNAVARYAMGLSIDEPLAMLRSSATHYYSADGLGSTTSLTDASGAVAASYTYDTFGNLAASTGTVVNPFRYTAREWDPETGLYFYRTRYYGQVAGRFVSEDPIGFAAASNFYPYVLNNPTNLVDPSGNVPVAVAVAWCVSNPACLRVAIAVGLTVTTVVVTNVATSPPARESISQTARSIGRGWERIRPRVFPLPRELTRDRAKPICSEDQKREEDCDLQRENDWSVCRILPNEQARARCWESAMERWVNCMRGRYIPPLITN